jgi:RNA polymerase sigma-B factor
MHRHRRLDDAELQRRQLAGDDCARSELAERYLPLARRLARRYRNRGEPLEDLVQVASVGLLKALRSWDPEHGAPLPSYAAPTIVGELRRHFRDRSWLVRPPRALQDLALAVHRAGAHVAQTGSRADMVSELAARLERSEDEIREAMTAIAARFATPHDARNADGDETPGLLERAAAPDSGYARVEHAMVLDELLPALDKRAREVVRLSFHDDLLQREIAERIGCSQMHVSRILSAALDRMRLHAVYTLAPSGA